MWVEETLKESEPLANIKNNEVLTNKALFSAVSNGLSGLTWSGEGFNVFFT